VVHSIDQLLEKLQFDNPILWVDVPYWEKAVQCFDRQFVVYNCMDAYADFSDIREFCPEINRMEEDLCHAAHIILTSSKHLQQRLSRYGKLAHLVPNGVDREHFNLERNLPLPPDLSTIPSPIIGYYGAIAEWFDLDLLTYAAEQLPQYSFVLIGDCTVNAERLRALPNVYFLGEKPYQELPNYVNHFEIAVIPFKRNELTISTNPVKLYEYLATGKPIVSVDLPEIKPFANVVYIARDYDEFVNFLEDVVGREAWWVKDKRKKATKDHDWNDRVCEVVHLLEFYQDAITRKSLFTTLGSNGKEGVQ
jgi:glycosyltransferase involved in cell wall biosynthesis